MLVISFDEVLVGIGRCVSRVLVNKEGQAKTAIKNDKVQCFKSQIDTLEDSVMVSKTLQRIPCLFVTA